MVPDFFGPPFEEPLDSTQDVAARLWLADHPIVWAMMIEVAFELAKDGVPFGMKLVCEMLRHRFRVMGWGRMATNTYTGCFVRLLRSWDPVFRKLMTSRGEKAAEDIEPMDPLEL